MIIVKRKNKMRNVIYLEKSRVIKSVLSKSKKKALINLQFTSISRSHLNDLLIP